MLAAILLAAATTTTLPPPAAGLELIPGPAPRPVIASQPIPPTTPTTLPPVLPHPSLFGGAVAALLASIREAAIVRRRQALDGVLASVPADLNVVFVGGYNSDTTGTFDKLIAALGLRPGQIHSFDYRWVEPGDYHISATKDATHDEIVDGLNGFLAGLATNGRPIYLVGFSKGGAGIAGLLKKWDLHPDLAIESVIGAAMLDPPVADGTLGKLQSPGVGFLPNDGGYDPHHCRLLGHFNCTDTRAYLGRLAGVEVVAFRNIHSNITNFTDHPPGLRVYDAAMPEPSALGVGYITQAHGDVLLSSALAACLIDEMNRPGACRWDQHRALPPYIDDWQALRN